MAKKSNVWNRVIALNLRGALIPGGVRIPHSFGSFSKLGREERSKVLRQVKTVESRRRAVSVH